MNSGNLKKILTTTSTLPDFDNLTILFIFIVLKNWGWTSREITNVNLYPNS